MAPKSAKMAKVDMVERFVRLCGDAVSASALEEFREIASSRKWRVDSKMINDATFVNAATSVVPGLISLGKHPRLWMLTPETVVSAMEIDASRANRVYKAVPNIIKRNGEVIEAFLRLSGEAFVHIPKELKTPELCANFGCLSTASFVTIPPERITYAIVERWLRTVAAGGNYGHDTAVAAWTVTHRLFVTIEFVAIVASFGVLSGNEETVCSNLRTFGTEEAEVTRIRRIIRSARENPCKVEASSLVDLADEVSVAQGVIDVHPELDNVVRGVRYDDRVPTFSWNGIERVFTPPIIVNSLAEALNRFREAEQVLHADAGDAFVPFEPGVAAAVARRGPAPRGYAADLDAPLVAAATASVRAEDAIARIAERALEAEKALVEAAKPVSVSRTLRPCGKVVKSTKTCSVCLCDSERRVTGVECNCAPVHFICKTCFESCVEIQACAAKGGFNPVIWRERKGAIVCPNAHRDTDMCFAVEVIAFFPKAIGMYVASQCELATAIARDKAEEEVARARIEGAERVVKRITRPQTELFEDEMRVSSRYVFDYVLTRKCPVCRAPFSDYTGCSSVHCDCGAYICGLCLIYYAPPGPNASHDTHMHVKDECKYNPDPGNSYVFVDSTGAAAASIRRATFDRLVSYVDSKTGWPNAIKGEFVARIKRDLLDNKIPEEAIDAVIAKYNAG